MPDISLRGETYTKLKAKAAELGMTPSQLARKWIHQYQPFTKRLLPSLRRRPGEDDDFDPDAYETRRLSKLANVKKDEGGEGLAKPSKVKGDEGLAKPSKTKSTIQKTSHEPHRLEPAERPLRQSQRTKPKVIIPPEPVAPYVPKEPTGGGYTEF